MENQDRIPTPLDPVPQETLDRTDYRTPIGRQCMLDNLDLMRTEFIKPEPNYPLIESIFHEMSISTASSITRPDFARVISAYFIGAAQRLDPVKK